MYDALKRSPTAAEVRHLIERANLTNSQAGILLGVNSRTIRKWTGGERPMPPASWRLLQVLVGEIGIDHVWADSGIDRRFVNSVD